MSLMGMPMPFADVIGPEAGAASDPEDGRSGPGRALADPAAYYCLLVCPEQIQACSWSWRRESQSMDAKMGDRVHKPCV